MYVAQSAQISVRGARIRQIALAQQGYNGMRTRPLRPDCCGNNAREYLNAVPLVTRLNARNRTPRNDDTYIAVLEQSLFGV